MKPRSRRSGVSRRSVLTTAAALPMLSLPHIQTGWAQSIDPLPSWNKGVAKETIIGFVQGAVDGSSRAFVPPEARIATFDQDGTLWVEHPIYAQVAYCLERVPAVVAGWQHGRRQGATALRSAVALGGVVAAVAAVRWVRDRAGDVVAVVAAVVASRRFMGTSGSGLRWQVPGQLSGSVSGDVPGQAADGAAAGEWGVSGP